MGRNQAGPQAKAIAGGAIRVASLAWRELTGLLLGTSTRRIRITVIPGVFFLLLILMIGVAAFNTGTNLLYLMLATLLSLWALTPVLCWVNLRRIELARRLPPEIHADQWIEMELTATNRKRFWASYGVTIQEMTRGVDPQRHSVYLIALLPGRQTTGTVEIRFLRRGWIEFRKVNVISGFPFGLLEMGRVTPLPLKVLVYPKLLEVAPLMTRRSIELGMQESTAKGQGTSLYSIRDYVPGDPARSISWKLSAKGGGIKVRELEREESQRIRLVYDWRVPDNPVDRDIVDFERGISLTASLAKYFLDLGFETALWTRSQYIPSGVGIRQMRRIMESLALARMSDFATSSEAFAPAASEGTIDFRILPTEEGLTIAAANGNGNGSQPARIVVETETFR